MTNLLFIFTDEQHHDTINDPALHMPNLNRLAAQSTVFERTYCTQPVCTPSRSSLMSGLYPHATGCTGNNIALAEDIPTIAEMLPPEVSTAYHGKWHLGDEIFAQHGFREWISIEDDYIRHYSEGHDRDARSDYHHYLRSEGFQPDHYKDGRVFSREFACRIPERYSKPAFQAREASRFIRKHKHEPWVLYVSILEPHMPFFSARDDQYDPATIPMPENFDHIPGADHHPRARFNYAGHQAEGYEGHDLTTDGGWRDMAAKYRGLNSLVDTHVGVILDTLEAEGLTDDTIVVFTSDHGELMGSHRLLGKGQIYEEASRVPMMIRLPGQRTGRVVRNPFSQIDLVPTLLDLLDEHVPAGLHGISRRDVLEGGPEPVNDVFFEMQGSPPNPNNPRLDLFSPEEQAALVEPRRAVVTPDGWKFGYSPNGFNELYDLNNDPGERVNMADKNPARVDEMMGKLRDWQQQVGDEA